MMTMTKQQISREIAALTFKPGWEDDPQVLARLEELRTKFSKETERGGGKRAVKVIYPDGREIVANSIKELHEKAGVGKSTIQKYLKLDGVKDAKGRRFIAQ